MIAKPLDRIPWHTYQILCAQKETMSEFLNLIYEQGKHLANFANLI
jgi:hypothetical protein